MGANRTATGIRWPRTRRLVILAVMAALGGCAPAGSGNDETSSDSIVATDQTAVADAPSETVEDGRYEWAQMPIGAGGFVTGIVSTPVGARSEIFSRTDVGGAYRWHADQQVWEQMLRPSRFPANDLSPDDYSVLSIAVAPGAPDSLYLAVGNDFAPSTADEDLARGGRVLRSGDGGATWTASTQRWFVAGNQRSRTGTERLAVDPADPEHVLFGTQREGLWESVDGGATWRQVPLTEVPAGFDGDIATDQPGVSFVAASPGTGGATTFHVGVANVGVFASVDNGSTWERVVELAVGEVPSSPIAIDGDLVFSVNTLDGAPGRLLRLGSDLAIAPIETPIDSQVWNLAIDPFDPDRMVLADEAVRDGHFWSSTDSGSSWRQHDIEIESPAIPWLERTDLTSYMSVGRLMFDPTTPGQVWFVEGMGVWVADDLDAQSVVWESRSRGIEELVVSSLLAPPERTPIVAVADRQGFLLDSADRYPAATLVDERFASGSGLDYSGGFPDVVAWVGAESNIGSSPDRTPRGAVSHNGGRTWEEMEGLDQDMFGGEVAVSATDPDTIVWQPTYYSDPTAYLTTPVGLRVSSDGGQSWDTITVDGDVHSFHRLFWWFTRRRVGRRSCER